MVPCREKSINISRSESRYTKCSNRNTLPRNAAINCKYSTIKNNAARRFNINNCTIQKVYDGVKKYFAINTFLVQIVRAIFSK